MVKIKNAKKEASRETRDLRNQLKELKKLVGKRPGKKGCALRKRATSHMSNES